MSHSLKKKILSALESNDLDAVVALSTGDRTVLSRLVRLAYDKETLVGWRAIKAVGLAARALQRSDYDFLRDTCRKLLWSLSDESGGIGWSAPEMLGEIVSADPRRFADIIPLIVQVFDIEEDVFRPGVVYALGRIAEADPEAASTFQKVIISSLVDREPLTRIYGLDLVEVLWRSGTAERCWTHEYRERIRSAVSRLRADKTEAWVYRDPQFVSVMTGEYASVLINKLI